MLAAAPGGCDTLLDGPVSVISCANALLKQNTLPNMLYQPKQQLGEQEKCVLLLPKSEGAAVPAHIRALYVKELRKQNIVSAPNSRLSPLLATTLPSAHREVESVGRHRELGLEDVRDKLAGSFILGGADGTYREQRAICCWLLSAAKAQRLAKLELNQDVLPRQKVPVMSPRVTLS